ncbi:hypothetical protein VMCG_10361 [Cytospora schulzeri]|uniref:Glutathione S-transferase UstS-like C-terminal domain-containing protein n=1 Tax=Cytospora schulzeri TaxID=448051 RepID=A0A423VFI3_9PEZI|nr:hypothetical protein VMCG_10361 [Valsa malicola]
MTAKPITFYDIASGPPVRPFAPNPCKTRYALNFKRSHGKLDYQTSWTELTQVARVRQNLHAAPCRKHEIDGSDFYTLPVIVDHSKGQTIGDSFDIALYLDQAYPSSPPLFPPATVALHRVFNARVDKVFTDYVVLVYQNMPFNPETAAESKAEFCRRAGRKTWEELGVNGEVRREFLQNFENELGMLAKLYLKTDEGPFLEGKTPMYADLIVGGWLRLYKETLPEWHAVQGWQGGIWGRLHKALERYATAY